MQVLYIASAGRSGSTILDIVLGDLDGNFSCGELINLISNGVFNHEYCSCQERVIDCSFWSKVLSEWEEKRELSLTDYQKIIAKYQRNMATISLLFAIVFPNRVFKKSLKDTRVLYELISKYSNCEILIDSSKSAQRLLFLKASGINVFGILLKRPLKNVLNSLKKEVKKDKKNGIEKDFPPTSTWYAIFIWLFDTYLPRLFISHRKSVNVDYEEFLQAPDELIDVIQREINPTKKVKQVSVKVRHLCAGNRMRMNPEIKIIHSMDNDLKFLGNKDIKVLRVLRLFGIR